MFNYKDTILISHVAGSKAYGTNIATSDTDVRGIFTAPKKSILTPFYPIREVTGEGEDCKYYELNNYMKLYLEMNPNILETLWIDKSSIIDATPEYWKLREVGQTLLTSKVAFTFSGYAMAQLKRIKGHNKHINNPQPEQRPEQREYFSLVYNMTKEKIFKFDKKINDGYQLIKISGNLYAVFKAPGKQMFSSDGSIKKYDDAPESIELTDDGLCRVMPDFIVKFNFDVYERSMVEWTQYWDWVKNRNQTRSALEIAHGYDTKHGMHLIRLMRMGEEILKTGKVNVLRPDAQELLDIRNGKWSYQELVQYAEEKDDYIRNTLYKNTNLPKYPNIKKASDILMEIQELQWGKYNG